MSSPALASVITMGSGAFSAFLMLARREQGECAMARESKNLVKVAVRERTLQGRVSSLNDAELLAVLLGTGCEGQPVLATANALLDFAGSLSALQRLGPHLVAMQRGVGPAKAARLAAAVELARRWVEAESDQNLGVELKSFDAVVKWARARLGSMDHEEMWTLALDGQNHLLQARCVARGGQHGCSVHVRDILRVTLRDGASGLVVIHNHPSGDPKPSREDISMTAALVEACQAIGLPLLDHVIVSRGGSVSLFELGVLSVTAA